MKLSLNKHSLEALPMTRRTQIVEEATDRLREYLRGRKLRLTPERLALLHAALGVPGHFDAEEMVAHLRRRRSRVSRATIYRTLALFERCGILRKSLLKQGRGVYERALGRDHHDHIVCAGCGRIDEFYDERVEKLQVEVAGNLGFQIIDHLHELVGFCRACADNGSTRATAAKRRKG
jgi:Fur family transcriptional regulator, ferric uptake regulator